MTKPIKRILRFAAIIVVSPLFLISGFLAWCTVTEFIPAPVARPESNTKGVRLNPRQRILTLITWNIGYAGMGKEMDFFYDGGRMVIPSQKGFNRALAGIKRTVTGFNTADFVFIQEIDRQSKRAYDTDILSGLSGVLRDDYYAFGKTYDCPYLPVPLREPMGHVVSGLATFSRYRPDSAAVVSLHTLFPWPKRMALLKRCFVATRYNMGGGKELVIVNTHNSAFDATGKVREGELRQLREYLIHACQHGNWVICGGDWNCNPSGFDPSLVFSCDPVYKIQPPISENFLPGWTFISDPWHASNRDANMPYTKGITRTTTLDFFVVSPNIHALDVKTMPLGFEFSDHNPVEIRVELK